ncbi:hypothetical protein [Streptomyces sp. NPDC008150]|uniref:hypothetical protein n=1 Tax=Streptomyces sp. NPDC008150 TaxID=3364816 RepID=UPI0036F14EDB
MDEYRGSYSAEDEDPEVLWHEQRCQVCGRSDVLWTYRIPATSPALGFALPARIYLCQDCNTLLQGRDFDGLSLRLRSAGESWPEPEAVIRALLDATASAEAPQRR